MHKQLRQVCKFELTEVRKRERERDQPVWHVARSVEARAGSRSGIHYMPLLYREPRHSLTHHQKCSTARSMDTSALENLKTLHLTVHIFVLIDACTHAPLDISQKTTEKKRKKKKGKQKGKMKEAVRYKNYSTRDPLLWKTFSLSYASHLLHCEWYRNGY